MLEIMDSLPITNNPQLSFLQQSSRDDRSNTVSSYNSNQRKYLPNNSVQINHDRHNNTEGIGEAMLKTLSANFVYCLLLGVISLISGILLTIIAFHGLQTNSITPIMGKTIINLYLLIFYLSRSSFDSSRISVFYGWIISVF